jgi:hypothetical protein
MCAVVSCGFCLSRLCTVLAVCKVATNYNLPLRRIESNFDHTKSRPGPSNACDTFYPHYFTAKKDEYLYSSALSTMVRLGMHSLPLAATTSYYLDDLAKHLNCDTASIIKPTSSLQNWIEDSSNFVSFITRYILLSRLKSFNIGSVLFSLNKTILKDNYSYKQPLLNSVFDLNNYEAYKKNISCFSC